MKTISNGLRMVSYSNMRTMVRFNFGYILYDQDTLPLLIN